MTDNTNEDVILSRTSNNMMAMQFPNKAAQNAFLESIGGQQFFPADAKFNAGKPCPTSVDETNNIIYFNGYVAGQGPDAGSLGIAFANETMRNNFYNTLFSTNESKKHARGYQGSPALYIAGLTPNSTNNLSIPLSLPQRRSSSTPSENNIRQHEQVVINPQEAKKHWEYMQKVHFELIQPAAGYTSKQMGLIENLERALLSISEGKDNFNATFGGQGRYFDANLPTHPNEALLYIMDQKNYDPLPSHVKAILGNIRNDIIYRERKVNPRFIAEQDALNAAKPLIAYLSTLYMKPETMLAIQHARNKDNPHPLGKTMENLGFKITYGRHGTLEFNLMNHEFSVDANNPNNFTVKLNFNPGQEQLNKIQPEKVDLLIKQIQSLENPVNKVKPQQPQLPNEKPLSQEQKQVISDFTQTHDTKKLLKESHLLHHQGQTGIFTQLDGAQNNAEKKEVKMLGKQIEHLNNPKHTSTTLSTAISNMEKNIDSSAQKHTPQKQKNSTPTFQKSGFKEFLKNLKEDLQTLKRALGLKSKNKLSTQNAQSTKKKTSQRRR